MDHNFELTFLLGNPQDDPAQHVAALLDGGFDDSTLGIGCPGRLGMMCSRAGVDARAARGSVVADVRRIIPGVKLVITKWLGHTQL